MLKNELFQPRYFAMMRHQQLASRYIFSKQLCRGKSLELSTKNKNPREPYS